MINSEDVKKTFMEISNNQYKQYCLLQIIYFCTTRLRNIAEWKQTIIIYVTRSIIIRYILKITRRYCCKY